MATGQDPGPAISGVIVLVADIALKGDLWQTNCWATQFTHQIITDIQLDSIKAFSGLGLRTTLGLHGVNFSYYQNQMLFFFTLCFPQA